MMQLTRFYGAALLLVSPELWRIPSGRSRCLAVSILMLCFVLASSAQTGSQNQALYEDLSGGYSKEPVWTGMPTGVQSITFQQSQLKVLSGSQEMLLATWQAQSTTAEPAARPITTPTGFAVERTLRLYGSRGRLYSTIQTFGLAGFAQTAADYPQTLQPTALQPTALQPMVLFTNPAVMDSSGIGSDAMPDRFTWWGRVLLPLAAAEQDRPEEERLLNHLLPLALRHGWRIEQEKADGFWERISAQEIELERSFQYREFTEEDWYFDPRQFKLTARVTAVYWDQESNGQQQRFRIRLVD